jgi:putative hemin transport protein
VWSQKQRARQLCEAWAAIRAWRPEVCPRAVAGMLGVAEAQLVAAHCGESVTRLIPAWDRVIPALADLGVVRVLTRNEHAILHQEVEFGDVRVLGEELCLDAEATTLHMATVRWGSGFAVNEVSRFGLRRSLQFFDVGGAAALKVVLPRTADVRPFEYLTAHLYTVTRAGSQLPPALWGEGGRQLAPLRPYVPVSFDRCFSTMSPLQGDIV